MTRMCVAVMVLLVVGTGYAQGPITRVDVSVLGMGAIMLPLAVETDGHPDTREWLIRHPFSEQARVIAERNGGLCIGPWFSAGGWTVQRIGFTDWLTRLVGQSFERMPLMTPPC